MTTALRRNAPPTHHLLLCLYPAALSVWGNTLLLLRTSYFFIFVVPNALLSLLLQSIVDCCLLWLTAGCFFCSSYRQASFRVNVTRHIILLCRYQTKSTYYLVLQGPGSGDLVDRTHKQQTSKPRKMYRRSQCYWLLVLLETIIRLLLLFIVDMRAAFSHPGVMQNESVVRPFPSPSLFS